MITSLLFPFLTAIATATLAPEVFWARVPPTAPRVLWIHGHDLWDGNPHDTRKASASIGETPLEWNRGLGGNNNEGNFSLYRVQRFILPASIPPGPATVQYVRNDGECTEITVAVPPIPSVMSLPFRGDVTFPGESYVAPAGLVADFGGRTWIAGPQYRSKQAVLVVPEGTWVANLEIRVEESAPNVPAIQVTGNNVRLQNIRIIHRHHEGHGIAIYEGTQDSTFLDLELSATRGAICYSTVDSRPNRIMARNNWLHVRSTGPRGCGSGEDSRIMNGPHNLFFDYVVRDKDRAMTGSSGQPCDANLLYECQLIRTGMTKGGSEGIFFEHLHGYLAKTQGVSGLVMTAIHQPGKDLWCRPGQVVADIETGRWAFVDASNILPTTPPIVGLTLSRSIGQPGSVWIGAAATRNTVARCIHDSGRGGIIWWGVALDNHVVGADYRDLRWAESQLETGGLRPNGTLGFGRGNVRTRSKYTHVDNEYIEAWDSNSLP